MAVFTEWLSGRSLTPTAVQWFSPSIVTGDGVTDFFAASTAASASTTPYQVTLTRTRMDAFGNIIVDTSPVASYNTGTNFSYAGDYVAPGMEALFYTTATAGASAGTSDLDLQRYGTDGQPAGSPTTLVSAIANYDEIAIGDAATYGSKYFVTYGTFDAAANVETINELAYTASGTPIPADSRVLDTFSVSNDLYDRYGFGTLLDSHSANPSFIYLKTVEENGSPGVLYQQVSPTGSLAGQPIFIEPYYANTVLTGRNIGRWVWTRLESVNLASDDPSNDLVIAMPYSGTNPQGDPVYGLDIRLLNTQVGGGIDDGISLTQSTDPHVTLAALPGGGLVVGYTDENQGYLREYDANGFVVGSSSFALPLSIVNFNITSLGDGRVLIEYPQADGNSQLLYSIFDTRQAGMTFSTAGETAPSSVAGTVNDDVFYINGAVGPDNIDGGGGTDFLVTTTAAGSGTVLADLKDGYVAKGNQVDAKIFGIQGVTFGSDTSVALGLTSGTDLFYGGSGSDSFYNEGATDYITGGTGSNAVIGGTGTTIFYGSGGTDTMKGGTGQNFMQAGPTTSSSDTFYGSGGTDFVYGGAGTTTLYGGSGTEDMTGGSGSNELIGSNQSTAALNIMNGGSGTDTFYAGVGTNLLYEGVGTDILAGNAGTDYIYGGSGTSFVYGGTGTDVVTTGAGNQYVKAGSGFTYFNDTAANLTAGRLDRIDNFAGGQGTNLYLPKAVQGQTSFVSQNGGTAVLTTVNGGTAEIFASGVNTATVQAHTHFTL